MPLSPRAKTFLAWFGTSALLFPVVFMVSCFGAMAYLTFGYREDIRGQELPGSFVVAVLTTSAPVTDLTSDAPAKEEGFFRLKSGKYAWRIRVGYDSLSGFKARHPDLSYYFTPEEAREFLASMRPLDDPEYAGGTVQFEVTPFAPGREHVHYKEEAGEFATECWYDATSDRVEGHYFRHHSDFGMGAAALFVSFLPALAISGCLGALVQWWRRKRASAAVLT